RSLTPGLIGFHQGHFQVGYFLKQPLQPLETGKVLVRLRRVAVRPLSQQQQLARRGGRRPGPPAPPPPQGPRPPTAGHEPTLLPDRRARVTVSSPTAAA